MVRVGVSHWWERCVRAKVLFPRRRDCNNGDSNGLNLFAALTQWTQISRNERNVLCDGCNKLVHGEENNTWHHAWWIKPLAEHPWLTDEKTCRLEKGSIYGTQYPAAVNTFFHAPLHFAATVYAAEYYEYGHAHMNMDGKLAVDVKKKGDNSNSGDDEITIRHAMITSNTGSSTDARACTKDSEWIALSSMTLFGPPLTVW